MTIPILIHFIHSDNDDPYRLVCDKDCQCLAEFDGFLQVFRVFPTNKTDLHDITEILLKVQMYLLPLNTVTISLY